MRRNARVCSPARRCDHPRGRLAELVLAIVNATAARTSTGSVAVNVRWASWVATFGTSALRAVQVPERLEDLMQVNAEENDGSAEAHAFACGSCLH